MTATTRTTKTMSTFVLIALMGNLFLSVAALRCHQCNSHTNEDCAHLIVNTPRGQRDNQYLQDCEVKDDAVAFCRKTVINFEVNDEHRIQRSCGWIPERTQNGCFTADNEGYKEIICTCSEEGCNGASQLLGGHNWLTGLTATAVSLIMAGHLRH